MRVDSHAVDIPVDWLSDMTSANLLVSICRRYDMLWRHRCVPCDSTSRVLSIGHVHRFVQCHSMTWNNTRSISVDWLCEDFKVDPLESQSTISWKLIHLENGTWCFQKFQFTILDSGFLISCFRFVKLTSLFFILQLRVDWLSEIAIWPDRWFIIESKTWCIVIVMWVVWHYSMSTI
jgi:hypothetical protein